jgi:hypothetical protein
LEGGPPIFRQDFTCPALLEDESAAYPYGAVTRFGPPFQTVPVPTLPPLAWSAFARHYLRSLAIGPLRPTDMLMSFPPATEMFQFAGFASPSYVFRRRWPYWAGFPHSDIRGSTIARISPRLFAACHVLHRLLVPRHPPNALRRLLAGSRAGTSPTQDPSQHRHLRIGSPIG